MVEWRELAGVPVHYDRDSAADYGTRGRPATFRSGPGFYRKVTAAFSELWTFTGRAEVITSAGAHVAKPGMHGQGRAFDLDGLFWADRDFVTRRDGYQGRNLALYYGVEAVLRRHFGTVLDHNFNQAHADHFHLDDGTGVGFRAGSRSLVLFVQAALNAFYAAGLRIDGAYGPRTRAALESHAGATTPAAWLAFLAEIAQRGLTSGG
jgi:hypothetical protein